MTINYALENLLFEVTGLNSTARRLFVKYLINISLAANQVLLPAYGFIYEHKIKICLDFSFSFFCAFSFLKDAFGLKSFRRRTNIFWSIDYRANH